MGSSPTPAGPIPLRPLSRKPYKVKKRTTKLSRQQEHFINEYVKGESATKAALKAGYSESTQASPILKSKLVKQEIQNRVGKVLRKNRMDANRVLELTARLADSNILDYVDITENGSFEVNLSKTSPSQAYAIQELSYDAQGRPKVRLVDKRASLELWGRFQHMFTDKVELTGRDGGPLTIPALDAIVQNFTINQQINVNQERSAQRQLPEAMIDGEVEE